MAKENIETKALEYCMDMLGGKWKPLILYRTLYGEIPPRVEYTLTPLGKSLLPVVQAMTKWGQKQTKEKVEVVEVPQNQQLPLF